MKDLEPCDLDEILATKCAPIIERIEKVIVDAEKDHVRPKVLIMSVQAFLALSYALKDYLLPFKKGKEGIVEYKGLKVIPNHFLKGYDVQVLGSAEDEIGHISNFNPPKAKPWNLSPLKMIKAIEDSGEEIQVREISTTDLQRYHEEFMKGTK